LATAAGLELQEAAERAERIAREVLAPNAARVDREAAWPAESIAAIRASGLLGLLVPEEYGGLGSDPFTFCRVVRAFGRSCPSSAMIYVMHCGKVRDITRYAHQPTQRKFLPRIAAGELLLCSNRNEPGASATHGYIGELTESLTPQPDGGYRFNCTKFFASGSSGADYFCVMGRVKGAPPGRDELWVLIPRDDPGLEVVESWDTLGMRGTRSNWVHYRDCRVEPDASLGEPSSGQFGDYTILGQAVVALAIGESALDFAVRFLRGELECSSGLRLDQDPNAQREVGELELILNAVRMICHQACLALATGDAAVIRPAINRAWYYMRLAGSDVPARALQAVGGRAIDRGLPLERYVRDGESIALMGPHRGSLAIGVGKTLLGDGPRFPDFWLQRPG
jgi:alkylation response protein AidB-like acyl-CoA dehydrogenase